MALAWGIDQGIKQNLTVRSFIRSLEMRADGAWIEGRNYPPFDPQKTHTGFEYSAFKKQKFPKQIPLEVIFRFGAPEGSSFWERADEKTCRQLGVSPGPGAFWGTPFIEFFSKREPADRYFPESEIIEKQILTASQLDLICEITSTLCLWLKEVFETCGMRLWDGKFEFGLEEPDQVVLLDSIGLDELRLEKKGQLYSKEFLRRFYRGSEWYREVQKRKSEGPDWQQSLATSHPSLPSEYVARAQEIYRQPVLALEKSFPAWFSHPVCTNLLKGGAI